MEPLIVVIALGGNALLQRGEPVSAENQRKNMRTAGASLPWAEEHALKGPDDYRALAHIFSHLEVIPDEQGNISMPSVLILA